MDSIFEIKNGPVRVVFEPTINCNLRCPMCDRTHKTEYHKHKNDKLDDEKIQTFLHDIGKYNTRYVLIIGGGEPLAEPNLLKYIEILKSYNIYIHLWTNGTLISEHNAEFLANNCDMITVSLDSFMPHINDKCRGVEGSTKRSVEGIRKLRQNNSKLYIRIHSVISALNIEHIEEFVPFAKEYGINEIGGALMNPFDFVPKEMRLSSKQMDLVEYYLDKVRKRANIDNIALAGCYEHISEGMINKLKKQVGNINCTAVSCLGLWSQATVRPNGDVSVCCFTYKPVLGNLHNQSFKEIWTSEKAMNLRKSAQKGELFDSPCKGCDLGNPVFTQHLMNGGSWDIFNKMIIESR